MLTALLIAVTGFTAGWFYLEYRADRQTDDGAARDAIRAASEGIVAVLACSPDSLSRDFDNAKSRITDEFQTYYQQFSEQIVAPAAQRAQLTATVRVVRAAVSDLHPDSAVVLAFIEQKTASKTKPEPVTSTNSVRVMLKKVHGRWLIDKLDVLCGRGQC
jgi:Mce-associated membrane protein